jgi:adenosyl cobinamide kinase/adenosyl cobinamide phosphate guanylyltransferase
VIILVLGGTRSGKSELAERVALRAATHGRRPVTYVATGQVADDDTDMAERVAKHRDRRPADWATVEAGVDLPAVLAEIEGPVLLDSLGTWVAGCPDLVPDADGLCAALRARSRGDDTVIVSEEVGMGVHPMTEAGRRFADALGELNRAVADVADEVLLAVAGRALPLPRWAPDPI